MMIPGEQDYEADLRKLREQLADRIEPSLMESVDQLANLAVLAWMKRREGEDAQRQKRIERYRQRSIGMGASAMVNAMLLRMGSGEWPTQMFSDEAPREVVDAVIRSVELATLAFDKFAELLPISVDESSGVDEFIRRLS